MDVQIGCESFELEIHLDVKIILCEHPVNDKQYFNDTPLYIVSIGAFGNDVRFSRSRLSLTLVNSCNRPCFLRYLAICDQACPQEVDGSRLLGYRIVVDVGKVYLVSDRVRYLLS